MKHIKALASKAERLYAATWTRFAIAARPASHSSNMTAGMLRRRLSHAAAAIAATIVLPVPAFAWSENGHQAIGAIADLLIQGSRAEAQVKSILGEIDGKQLTLQSASVWADCIRSIRPDRDFAYETGPIHLQACKIFESDSGIRDMADYARRNNSNCTFAGKNQSCHKSFHFADIDVKHRNYSNEYTGAHNYDVVNAIDAAILVLQGQPCPAPFHFQGKREALMLLVHFVGDLHQPLHVGTIYLDPNNGSVVNADDGHFDPATDTLGGNLIGGPGENMHAQWDKTTYALDRPDVINSLAIRAKRFGKTYGDFNHWAEIWAGDTVTVAQGVFQDVDFSVAPGKGWSVSYLDRSAYVHDMQVIQEQQVLKAGARLARLLHAMWPG